MVVCSYRAQVALIGGLTQLTDLSIGYKMWWVVCSNAIACVVLGEVMAVAWIVTTGK